MILIAVYCALCWAVVFSAIWDKKQNKEIESVFFVKEFLTIVFSPVLLAIGLVISLFQPEKE